MPTADAFCQTLEMPSLQLKDALNKIFDQVIRSNMRLQDLRNRSKDMQDDIRMMKRHLKMEDVEEEKRMKFALDPTEGKPADYAKEEFDWTKRTLQLGSGWSSNISNETQRQADLFSDAKPRVLWPESEKSENPKMPEENIQAPQGMASRENLPVWAGYEDGHTPDEAESDPPSPPKASEIEGGGLPNIESAGTVSMIIFDGESEPVRLDQLSRQQEMMLENGEPYRYYIEDGN